MAVKSLAQRYSWAGFGGINMHTHTLSLLPMLFHVLLSCLLFNIHVNKFWVLLNAIPCLPSCSINEWRSSTTIENSSTFFRIFFSFGETEMEMHSTSSIPCYIYFRNIYAEGKSNRIWRKTGSEAKEIHFRSFLVASSTFFLSTLKPFFIPHSNWMNMCAKLAVPSPPPSVVVADIVFLILQKLILCNHVDDLQINSYYFFLTCVQLSHHLCQNRTLHTVRYA